MPQSVAVRPAAESPAPVRTLNTSDRFDPGWSDRADNGLFLVFVLVPVFAGAIAIPIGYLGWLGVPLSAVCTVLWFRTIWWFVR